MGVSTFYYPTGDNFRAMVICPFIGCGASIVGKTFEDSSGITFSGECSKCKHEFVMDVVKQPNKEYRAVEEDLT